MSEELRGGTKVLVTLSVMLATIIQVLDTTIANVALPHMQGTLMTTQDQITWVLTSYIVASAIMTLPTGWLSGRYGRKNIFLVAVFGFTVTSMLCGLANSLPQMITYRILQGVFGAALVPLSQSTLLDINTRAQHGKAMALWGMGVMLGPILGPTLGGYLTDNYSWRWVFFINLPLGLISFIGILLFMPDNKRSDRPFDKLGFFTLSLAIGCLQLTMDRGEVADWLDSREILTYIALGLGAMWVYAIHTMQAKHPFLSPAMFRDRNLVTGLIFIFFVGILLLATMALLPPYLQNLMGYPVQTVGYIMAPRGIGTMFAMMLVGRLSGKIDPRVLIIAGLLMTAYSLEQMSLFSTFVPASLIISSGMLQGLGLGFIFVPLSTITYATLAPEYRSEATSLFSLIRNLGSSIGVSIAIMIFSRNTQIQHAYLNESVTSFSTWLDLRQNGPSTGDSLPAVLQMIDAEISRQATAIAFNSDFKIMMWVVLAVIPLVFFMRNPDREEKKAELKTKLPGTDNLKAASAQTA